MNVALNINRTSYSLTLDPRVTLLDARREHIGLTSSKKGCGHGQCSACTVLMNGQRINACLALACMHEGDDITTIEGLAQGDELHPVPSYLHQTRWLTGWILYARSDLLSHRITARSPGRYSECSYC